MQVLHSSRQQHRRSERNRVGVYVGCDFYFADKANRYLYVLDAKNTAVIAVQLVDPGNATLIGSYNASGLPKSESTCTHYRFN